MAAVTGTVSATVIQSRPSMKLTRLTNHRPASSRIARSIQSGQPGTSLRLSEAVKMMMATAAPCSNSRGGTAIDLMSSAKPVTAMNSVAAKIASGIFSSGAPVPIMMAAVASSVAAITAMPAPCGVGTRCDERAFGRASA
jgi:hypothetical protein